MSEGNTGRILALGALAVVLTGGAAVAQDKVVNVYNWSDYIAEEVLAQFEAETGIKVVYDTFDSNEIVETKLLAGGTGYDVVVPSAEFLSRQIKAGVFQPLDKSKLTNIGNMWDVVTTRVAKYDPDNAYSVNYMWGTTGLGYNEEKVTALLPDAPVESWALLFDPANAKVLAECGIHVLDAPAEAIPAALAYLGLDPDSREPADLERAEAVYKAIRPYIQKFHSSEYINALANGDICLALGWSGDIFQARDRAAEANNGVTVVYTVPKEGAQMWFDQLAIPADAPHPDNAHTFINFLMRPDVIAQASNYVYYANGNKASQELLDEEVIGDPAIYPDQETLDLLFTKLPYDTRTQRTVNRIWTGVKTGQ